MMGNIILTHLKSKEKKCITERLDKLIELRKEQLELFERNIINQLKDEIKILNETKKGRLPIGYALKKSRKCSDYIDNFLNGWDGGNEK